MVELLNYLNTLHGWELAKAMVVIFLVIFGIREFIGFFLKTGAILEELKIIRRSLTEKGDE